MSVQIKRVHEPPAPDDGHRVLVDRLWPRGVSKCRARLDCWMKDIAPSNTLRQWFSHRRERWEEFRRAYWEELDAQRERLADLQKLAEQDKVTLLFAAKDEAHNNAVVLQQWLRRNAVTRSPPPGPGSAP